MTVARRWWRGVPVGLLTVLAVVAPAARVTAAEPVELSLDGVTWSTTLAEDLFPVPQAAVPGDVITAALWVRNSSADPARVQLDVADDLDRVPGTLAGDLALTIDGQAVAGGARWDGPVLAPGAAVRIPLVVTFDAGSPSTTRLQTARVLDTVLLVQDVATPSPVAQAPAPGLARTGQDVVGSLALAGSATGVGLLLLAARRRARRADR